MKIFNRRDFNAGLLFIAIGAFFAIYSTEYGFGKGANIGPAYFPMVLAVLMSVLGLVVLVMAFLPVEAQEPPEASDWRGLGLVLGSVAFFALALPYAGFLIAVSGLVLFSALASPECRRLESVILAVALVVAGVAIFGYGLELQFSILPPALTQ